MQILLWLSNNLRLSDNAALIAALEKADQLAGGAQIFPVYIHDQTNPWPVQGASAWWLDKSLEALQSQFSAFACPLSLFQGDPVEIFTRLIKPNKTAAVCCSLNQDAHEVSVQKSIKALCDNLNIECNRYGGSLLFNPHNNLNKQGSPFQVFTPYYKHSVKTYPPTSPKKQPSKTKLTRYLTDAVLPKALTLTKLNLKPQPIDWATRFEEWQPGEIGAQKKLKQSVKDIVASYADTRNLPAQEGTSKLSPHLRFGEVSPGQVWHAVASQIEPEKCESYLRQLVWRDFSYALITHWKDFPTQPFKPRFNAFPWRKSQKDLTAWQQGKTGYPIVDAGMRQLWHTGWMHNRVRMIVASFLTKHLRIHWIDGARWFWDTLVDADIANNSAGWQWVAGSGADASPYFRIFNPMLQSEKFDKRGEYIRTWVPELVALPDKYIHTPWLAPSEILAQASVTIGTNYPAPIVDHAEARKAALDAYEVCKLS